MREIKIGILTVSDSCANNEAADQSGPNLVEMIKSGIIKNAEVVKTSLVPDEIPQIQNILKEWCEEKLDVILTTGGTGTATRDVTPEATSSVLDKHVPGIPYLMLKHSLEITPLAALSRGLAGIRKETLIINLPGSKKASKECLESIAKIIPHAVDLILGNKENVEKVHVHLQDRKSKVDVSNVAGRRRISPFKLVKVDEAQNLILGKCHLLKKEFVLSLEKSLGFVLAQNVISNDSLPPFDVSLKDGYAVRSSDSTLERCVVGCSTAGMSSFDVKVEPNCCVRINTGARIPDGADAVVQVESTKAVLISEENEEKKIVLTEIPSRGQDIRKKGSDFKASELLLESGNYLGPSSLGLLAAAGIISVRVYAKPIVGILSSGDELIDPKENIIPGKIRDSNRITLLSMLKQNDIITKDFGIVPDQPDALCSALGKAFAATDVMVTTGGMSMGEKDYLKDVLEQDFGAEILFGRVFLKPGKPTAFGVIQFEGKTKFWFGLPGNPASAAVTCHLFLLPALRKISGFSKVFPNVFSACLLNDVVLEDRPNYQRGILALDEQNKGCYKVKIIKNQSSSRIGSCVDANCLVMIPEQTASNSQTQSERLVAGSMVDVLLIDNLMYL